MMMNLFSSFDPYTSNWFMLNWASSLLLFLMLPMNFWFFPSRFNWLWIKIMMYMYNEMKILINHKFYSNILIFISIFLMIMSSNFMGLFPYIFTNSSHLVFSLSFALPLWFSMMIFGWMKNYDYMFTHLIPQGTPSLLMPFMVLIETISNIIRPWTLSIRLTANMIAGHLLLTLLGNTNNNINMLLMFIIIMIQNLLYMLEMSVALIQSYVFSILSILYSSETSHYG